MSVTEPSFVGVDVPFVFDTLDSAPELVGDAPPRSLAQAVPREPQPINHGNG
jgi:hypothetical protein